MEPKKSPAKGPLFVEGLLALREATWDVIQQSKKSGRTLVFWKNERVVHLTPEEAEAEFFATQDQFEASVANFRKVLEEQAAKRDNRGTTPSHSASL